MDINDLLSRIEDTELPPEAQSDLAAQLLDARSRDPAAFDAAAIGYATDHGPTPEEPDDEGLEAIGRRVWRNYLGDHRTSLPDRDWWTPADRWALYRALVQAVGRGRRVKCIGGGHSSAEIAKPAEILCDLEHLAEVGEPSFLRPDLILPEGQHLVSVGAGVRIHQLVDDLWERGQVLPNMGSYDGQTVAGALCTGTHGSGLHTGPMADLVRSIDLFAVEQLDGATTVRLLRIERSDGPTDPGPFAAQDLPYPHSLEQDDDLFDAVAISLGCFGIVVGLTLQVEDAFWLEEAREVVPWSQLEGQLARRVAQAKDRGHHWEFAFLPHPVDGQIPCLVTERRRVPHTRGDRGPQRRLSGQWLFDLEAILGSAAIGWFASAFPQFIHRRVVENFHQLSDPPFTPFRSSAPRIFVLGYGEDMRIDSIEPHVPVEQCAKAIGHILQLAEAHSRRGVWHTAPIGVRFVGASPLAAAMAHGRDTATLEVPLVKGTRERAEILARIEDRLTMACDARMHWGQRNRTTAIQAAQRYPRWRQWMRAYRRFNPVGTFDNAFTDRMGMSGGGAV